MSKASAFDKHLANSIMAGHELLVKTWQDPSTLMNALQPSGAKSASPAAGPWESITRFWSSLGKPAGEPPGRLSQLAAPYLQQLREQYDRHLQPAALQVQAEYAEHVQPHVDRALAEYAEHLKPQVDALLAQGKELAADAERRTEAALSGFSRVEVALMAFALALVVFYVLRRLAAACAGFASVSVTQRAATAFKSLPFVRGYVAQETAQVLKTMREDQAKLDVPGAVTYLELPEDGLDASLVIEELEARSANDYHYTDYQSKVTGAIYMTDTAHRELLHDAYCLFSQTNPIHADLFPSIRKLEAEVISMTASLLGGGPDGNSEVCGCMTSGGTESILTAMFASLAYQRKHRGITKPEILMAETAHAAYFKAASYSGAKLVLIRPNPRTLKLTAADVRSKLTSSTAVVIVSAVSYPHGVMDDVAAIAGLCRRRGVLVHCDACLGGFVLPFLRKLGHAVPPFDFAVPGVTSMSVDTHKYGQGHKGTSVLLYSSPDLRRCQYTSVTEWSGGMYISPGMAGSRSGALIATAWAAMRHLGEAGYLRATAETMDAALQFKACIESVPELEVCGQPAMCLVAFKSRSRKFDVWVLNEVMAEKGWHLAALIKPAALHFCFTHQHAHIGGALCADLLSSCEVVRRRAAAGEKAAGKAKIYGMTSSLPDRRGLGDLLQSYQDMLLSP